MRLKRTIFKGVQLLLGTMILSVAALLLLDHFEVVETVKPFVVMSGSMEPAVKLGSVVVVRPQPTYRPGEIITYTSNGDTKNPTTHRIVFRQYPEGLDGEPVYLTAGDANEDFDSLEVRPVDVVGKVLFSVPYLGYIVSMAKQPYGFILFVIVPATIVIYEELKTFLTELRKGASKVISWVRSRRRKHAQISSNSPSINFLKKREKAFPKAGAFVPVVGTILVLAAFTSAFYSDEEVSTGNIFGAAESFGPQIAQTLVIHEVLPVSSEVVGAGPNAKPCVWLEVYNGDSSSVDIKDFDLFDGTNTIALIHASLTLNPGEFALLAHDQSIWTQCELDRDTSTATGQLGTGSFDLNSQFLQLRDPSDIVIDTVQWGGSGEATPAQDESIERVPIGLNSATGSGWEPTDFIVREMPTPGYGSNLVLNEIFPSPSGGANEWVEIYNPSGVSINLNGWDLKDFALSPKDISGLGTITPSGFSVFEAGSGWLNNDGDTLQLRNPSDFVIDQHTFGNVSSDKSIGRKEDRHTDWVNPCTTVSKGSTNTGVCQP